MPFVYYGNTCCIQVAPTDVVHSDGLCPYSKSKIVMFFPKSKKNRNLDFMHTFCGDQIVGSTWQSCAIKNTSDRDHITPIWLLYKLGLQPMSGETRWDGCTDDRWRPVVNDHITLHGDDARFVYGRFFLLSLTVTNYYYYYY